MKLIMILIVTILSVQAQADIFEDQLCQQPLADTDIQYSSLLPRHKRALFNGKRVNFFAKKEIGDIDYGNSELKSCKTLSISSNGNVAAVKREFEFEGRTIFQVYLVSQKSNEIYKVLNSSEIFYEETRCGGGGSQSVTCRTANIGGELEILETQLNMNKGLEKFHFKVRALKYDYNTTSGERFSERVELQSIPVNFCGLSDASSIGGYNLGLTSPVLPLTDNQCEEYTEEEREVNMSADFAFSEASLNNLGNSSYSVEDILSLLPSTKIGPHLFSSEITSSIYVNGANIVDVSGKLLCSEVSGAKIIEEYEKGRLSGRSRRIVVFQGDGEVYFFNGELAPTTALQLLGRGPSLKKDFLNAKTTLVLTTAKGRTFLAVGIENCVNL